MYTIILAEDDKTVRDSIYDLLSLEGYNCLVTCNGEEALNLIERKKADLIISDIMMPKLDGIGLFKILNKRGLLNNTPFIFLTAKNDYHSIRNGMNLGADDYLAKPFSSGELLEAVKTRIDKRVQVQTKFDELRNNIIKYIPHELKTPLISVMGYSSMLLEDCADKVDEETLMHIKSIYESGKRLNRTIDKFLVYAELRSVRSFDEIHLPEEDKRSLNQVVDDIIGNLSTTIKNGNKYVKDIDDITPKLNIKFIEILLTELIENAYKFSTNNSDVIISAYQNKVSAAIIVQNNGKAFKDEDKKNIGPFIQFNKETEQQQGNGLGLAIACRILELAGGKLKIDSTKNVTTVVVDLPIIHNNQPVEEGNVAET